MRPEGSMTALALVLDFERDNARIRGDGDGWESVENDYSMVRWANAGLVGFRQGRWEIVKLRPASRT